MERCEYNPVTKKPSLDPPAEGDCQNEATIIVGAMGQWYLYLACAMRPEFGKFKQKSLDKGPPMRMAKDEVTDDQ
jgi:hypothetical protein